MEIMIVQFTLKHFQPEESNRFYDRSGDDTCRPGSEFKDHSVAYKASDGSWYQVLRNLPFKTDGQCKIRDNWNGMAVCPYHYAKVRDLSKKIKVYFDSNTL